MLCLSMKVNSCLRLSNKFWISWLLVLVIMMLSIYTRNNIIPVGDIFVKSEGSVMFPLKSNEIKKSFSLWNQSVKDNVSERRKENFIFLPVNQERVH